MTAEERHSAIVTIAGQLEAILRAYNVAQAYHACADTTAEKRLYAVTIRGLKAMREDKRRQLREVEELVAA